LVFEKNDKSAKKRGAPHEMFHPPLNRAEAAKDFLSDGARPPVHFRKNRLVFPRLLWPETKRNE